MSIAEEDVQTIFLVGFNENYLICVSGTLYAVEICDGGSHQLLDAYVTKHP
jgi:hypothetical protein